MDEKSNAELCIVKSLMHVLGDGCPLVRAEVAVGMLIALLICGT